MADERYKDALKYALGLDRPHCALKVHYIHLWRGKSGLVSIGVVTRTEINENMFNASFACVSAGIV